MAGNNAVTVEYQPARAMASTDVAYSTLETSATSAWPHGTLRTFVGYDAVTVESQPARRESPPAPAPPRPASPGGG